MNTFIKYLFQYYRNFGFHPIIKRKHYDLNYPQQHTAFVIQLQKEGEKLFWQMESFYGALPSFARAWAHWPDVSNRDFTLSSILFAGNNNASGTMIDDKSKQWFGASVHSSGQDGIIVVRFTFNFVYYWSLRLGIQWMTEYNCYIRYVGHWARRF